MGCFWIIFFDIFVGFRFQTLAFASLQMLRFKKIQIYNCDLIFHLMYGIMVTKDKRQTTAGVDTDRGGETEERDL